MWLNLQTQNWRFREGHKNGHTCRFWLIIEAASSARREEQDCKVPEPGSKYARFLRGRKIAIFGHFSKIRFWVLSDIFSKFYQKHPKSAQNTVKCSHYSFYARLVRFQKIFGKTFFEGTTTWKWLRFWGLNWLFPGDLPGESDFLKKI